MQAVSLHMRILLFLYSTKNLVGCVLAIAALALFFLGIINDWWFPIVVGCYAIGWLAVPADKELELKIRSEATQANLAESIEDLIDASKTKLPHEAIEHLQHIRSLTLELAPRLFSGEVPFDYVISVNNAVTRDLPETVKNYLQLPSAFATLHVVHGGKTCKQLLLEQLDLLKQQLGKIAENIYKNDAEALVINGQFLKEKFHPVSFLQD